MRIIIIRGDLIPVSTAPYTRKYQHTHQRGSEATVRCDKCGRIVPRWKTFISYRGFRINDPVILKQMDRRFLHLMREKQRVCPKCARFYHIVQRGKSVRKKHMFK
jgi:small subunit ribosomal protein S26e